jgi:hypothetical protein
MSTRKYVFANWGERVSMIDGAGRAREGVITEFDDSDTRNTKVVYQGGAFDWFNRDEVEESMIAKEQVEIDTNETTPNLL